MASDKPSDELDPMDHSLDDALNTLVAALRGSRAAEILRDTVGGGIERLRYQRATLQRELDEARAELTEANRGDPHGHLLAVYQVLRGSNDVAGELFENGEPRYERVVQKAKELRANQFQAAIDALRVKCDADEELVRADRNLLERPLAHLLLWIQQWRKAADWLASQSPQADTEGG